VTADMQTSIRASRRRVARTRGALSGLLLVILGAWAGVAPFIGPYFDLAYTPQPNDAWHWTAARGWLEVAPGAAVFLGGLILLASASRPMTLFGGWLAALGGAWLIVGPPLAGPLNLDLGSPDPTRSSNIQALTSLLFFYAVGAVILFFASVALGRVSVLSVRDVRAAERRAEAEEAERRAAAEAMAAERGRAGYAGAGAGEPGRAGYAGAGATTAMPVAGRHAEAPAAGPASAEQTATEQERPRRRHMPRVHLPHRHRTTTGAPDGTNGQPAGSQPPQQYQQHSGGQPQNYPPAPPPPQQG
jgi:hypothetical protein